MALLFLLWYPGRMQSEAMLSYAWVWLGMFAYRRLTPGRDVVTEYQGYPFTTGWLLKDELLARLAEIPLVFACGTTLASASPAMGQFLMWASLLLAVKYWIESTYMKRIEEAEDDAILMMKTRMAKRNRR